MDEIKEARERRMLTQQDVATALGVSVRTVGNWERGESVPRNRTAALRALLGMDEPDPNREETRDTRMLHHPVDPTLIEQLHAAGLPTSLQAALLLALPSMSKVDLVNTWVAVKDEIIRRLLLTDDPIMPIPPA